MQERSGYRKVRFEKHRIAMDVEGFDFERSQACLLYTSDAADERSSVDPGGRRILKKKKNNSI